MNQELRQRLIGAVVVTALAAIFIPMLFDDPIDNSGQKVSELVIPETPVKTGEESANKLPVGVAQVLNKPATESEKVVTEEAELATDEQSPPNELSEGETAADAEVPVDEPENDGASESLDTGVVAETKAPVKIKKAVDESEYNQQKLTSRPVVEEDVAASAKKPVKANEKAGGKSSKSNPELGRWFIQAGTFSKKENALSLLNTLRKQGLPVTMDVTKGLYRLKVGPSLDKKRAAEMKAKLDSQKISSILIAE
ncbi:MAG: SPOR domain-containing protein [Methylococcales bacterium]|nr:SPOR domain-containing protein [Methylococcales bacterium]